MLVVLPHSPVADVPALIALARARPGQLNFASPTSGTVNHLLGELLREPEFERRVEAFGMRIATTTPTELSLLIEQDVSHWAALVKSSGARAD